MARLSYECDNVTKGPDDGDALPRPFPCSPDKICIYCCCNPQCCFVLQRRPPKHFWEAWYFWLGVALLLIIVLSTIGTYVVTNCKQNLQAIGYGISNNTNGNVNRSNSANSIGSRSSDGNDNNQRQLNEQEPNRNDISINIIPTSAVMPTHRKIMFIAPQSSCSHLSRKCVCTSKVCKESGAKVCRTRFSCYTELIYNDEELIKEPGRAVKTTRGCTEGATPLLCESKSWHPGTSKSDEDANPNTLDQLGRAPWPRLTCCDSHDYCNAADEDFEPQLPLSSSSSRPSVVSSSPSSSIDQILIDARHNNDDDDDEEIHGMGGDRRDYRSATVTIDGSALGAHQTVQHLHIAALILAIAALISVFAACYVVTRFLSASNSLSRRISQYDDDRLDF